MLARVVCFFAACSLAVLIAVAGEPTANDAEALQGLWQAVDLEANGRNRLPIRRRSYRSSSRRQAVDQARRRGPKDHVHLDAAKTPKTIDLTPLDGPRRADRARHLLSGQWALRLCVNIFGKDPTRRPTEFKTQEGDGAVLVTLERAKHE
jgi:uncharacterized protein (TIGR03067 family)